MGVATSARSALRKSYACSYVAAWQTYYKREIYNPSKTVKAASLPGDPMTPPPETYIDTDYNTDCIWLLIVYLGELHCHKERDLVEVWNSWDIGGKDERYTTDPMT